jgi:hypothetical protein
MWMNAIHIEKPAQQKNGSNCGRKETCLVEWRWRAESTHCLEVETREQNVRVTGEPANACNSMRGIGLGAEESRKGVPREIVRK